MARVSVERDTTIGRALSGVVTGLGLAALAYSTALLLANGIRVQWVLLSLVTVLLASRLDIGVPRLAGGLALGDVLVFMAVLLFGPHPAVTLAGADAAIHALQHKQSRRVVLYDATRKALAAYVASTVAALLFGDLTGLATDMLTLGAAAAVIAAVHFVCNSGVAGLIEVLRSGRSLAVVRQSLWWAAISYGGGALMTCVIVKLITVISFYAFILAVPITAIIYFTYRVYLERVETSNRHAEQMADLHLRTIEALAIAIEAKDEVTQDHVRRVQIYATGLARLFGLSDLEIEALKAGALLHDIGKLAVPDYILNKPSKLTPAEFEKMKVHTTVGAEILERVGFPY
ncbi:MAG TPA: HD domain-containing protein, partial [Blastocatellia bacterium]|nr:HD domain-containing protein [Blastocatellia bacterium]